MRRVKQLGVNHVIGTAGPMPWTEEHLGAMMAAFKKGGLSLGNCMIGGFPKTLFGQPGRDQVRDAITHRGARWSDRSGRRRSR